MRPILCATILCTAFAAGGRAHAKTRLSLAEAIDHVRHCHSDVAQADIDTELANLNVLRAWLERVHFNVSTSFTQQYEKLNMNAPSTLCQDVNGLLCNTSNEAHLFNATAALDVPVWSGFTVEADLARARSLQRASSAERQSRLRELSQAVTNAYWEVRRAELLLELGRAAVHRDDEVAQLSKARVDAGIAALVDYNRAASAALRQRHDLSQLEERVLQARAELAAVLQIDDDIELTEDPIPLALPPPPLRDVLAEAAHARPELRVAEAQWEARVQEVRSLQGGFWPHIDLFAHASAENQAFGVPQPTIIGNFTAGVMVNWTIFDGMVTVENVREAQLVRDRSAFDRVRVAFAVQAEVRAAHARLQKALERREPILRAMAFSQSSVNLIRKRYKEGTALLIEVLQAQSELAQLESQSAENAIEIAEASAGLVSAMGRR